MLNSTQSEQPSGDPSSMTLAAAFVVIWAFGASFCWITFDQVGWAWAACWSLWAGAVAKAVTKHKPRSWMWTIGAALTVAGTPLIAVIMESNLGVSWGMALGLSTLTAAILVFGSVRLDRRMHQAMSSPA